MVMILQVTNNGGLSYHLLELDDLRFQVPDVLLQLLAVLGQWRHLRLVRLDVSLQPLVFLLLGVRQLTEPASTKPHKRDWSKNSAIMTVHAAIRASHLYHRLQHSLSFLLATVLLGFLLIFHFIRSGILLWTVLHDPALELASFKRQLNTFLFAHYQTTYRAH